MLNERLLITKIVTCLGLALLLVIGAWSAMHHEAENPAEVAAAVPAVAAAEQSHPAVSDAFTLPSTSQVSQASGILLGVVGCALGVLCVLIMFVAVRRRLVRSPSHLIQLSPRLPLPPIVSARPFTPPLSLAQLSLSRT